MDPEDRESSDGNRGTENSEACNQTKEKEAILVYRRRSKKPLLVYSRKERGESSRVKEQVKGAEIVLAQPVPFREDTEEDHPLRRSLRLWKQRGRKGKKTTNEEVVLIEG